MIELALTLTLLMMLLVGTVTSAIAFGQQNSIQNAAREASRFAATLPGAVDLGWQHHAPFAASRDLLCLEQ